MRGAQGNVASERFSRQNPPPCALLSAQTTRIPTQGGVKTLLEELGHETVDYGCFSEERCDYPDYCRPAAEAVRSGECQRCIVFGGSGNGEAIVANRVPGVRAPLCWNQETARLGREHNDANGLALGARVVDQDLALEIVRIWLDTPFEGGRHLARIRKIDDPGYLLWVRQRRSRSCPTIVGNRISLGIVWRLQVAHQLIDDFVTALPAGHGHVHVHFPSCADWRDGERLEAYATWPRAFARCNCLMEMVAATSARDWWMVRHTLCPPLTMPTYLIRRPKAQRPMLVLSTPCVSTTAIA